MTSEQIIRHVKSSRLREVLIGEGEYFDGNHTYRDQHDITRILDILCHWACCESQDEFHQILQNTLLELAQTRPEVALRALVSHQTSREFGGPTFSLDEIAIFAKIDERITAEEFSRISLGASLTDVLNNVRRAISPS